MDLSIDKLIEGKPLIIRNKQYLSTEQYITPFLERMSKFTSDFRIQVKRPDTLSLNKENLDLNDCYTRVLIQAVLPEELAIENHKEVIGLVYGLDVRKPVAKIYRGALNMACTNLCVFDPSFLNVQFINPEKGISYRPVELLMEQADDMKTMLDNLKNTEWEGNPQNIESNLGRWIRNAMNCEYNTDYGTIKVGTDVVIKAYSSMFIDNESPYFIGEGNNVDMFTVYNAFTELISNDKGKDLMNKVEKVLLLRNILNF